MTNLDTQVFAIDPNHPDPAVIAVAAETLSRGGLVAFPTETVYGLGANAMDSAAVNGIFEAKGRPASDPLIVHIAALEALEGVARDIPPLAYTLASAFWPGPLTLVLPRHSNIPANVSAGLDTVAVRMPRHPVALALLNAAGLPIAAPSANTFSRPSATTAAHVYDDLRGRIDLILDGGATPIGLESTVLDLTGELPLVLRPGGVTLEQLEVYLPNIEVRPRYLAADTAATSPGQSIKHYSPRAPMVLFTGSDPERIVARMKLIGRMLRERGQQVGILAADEESSAFADLDAQVIMLGSAADLAEIGANLFARIREIDALGVESILVRAFGREGLGIAIWDRLVRAAEGRIIEVD
jgi:L-threonylcarbamoyladenylate synthase